MYSIEVEVSGTAPEGRVDELTGRVPELAEHWRSLLDSCGDSLELPCLSPGEKNSSSFQVIGMLYRTVRTYQREHGRPETVRILCDCEDTARLYRQIYNFYVPTTRAERMPDPDWD